MDELAMSSMRKKANIGGCAAMLSAGLSIMMYSVCLGTIQTEFGMSAVVAGMLSTIVLVGQAVGGILAGYISDHVGRPKVLAVSVILVTAMGILVSFVNSEIPFAVIRFVSGLGLGSCYYLSVIYVGEFYDTRIRAAKGAIVVAFWSLGYVLANLMSAYLLADIGWRWMFRISAITIFFGFWMFFALKEAPGAELMREQKIAARKEKPNAKKQNEYAILFSSAENIKKTIVWILSRIFYMFGYYAAITWLPNFVQTSMGLDFKSAGWFTAANYIAMIIGTIIGGYVSDKLGRKRSYVLISILLGCMAPVVAFGTNAANVLIIMLIWGFLYGLPTGSSATFMGESWPNEIRGTAVGFTYNCGRIGSWLAPILVGAFVDAGLAGVGIATVGIGYVVSALILVPFVKEKEYDMAAVQK